MFLWQSHRSGLCLGMAVCCCFFAHAGSGRLCSPRGFSLLSACCLCPWPSRMGLFAHSYTGAWIPRQTQALHFVRIKKKEIRSLLKRPILPIFFFSLF